MPNRITVALALAGLLTINANASSLFDAGHPVTEAQVIQLYPDAVKLSEGVYDVKRGDRGRIFLFGSGGLKYRLDALIKFRGLAAATAGVSKQDLANMDQNIALARTSLQKRMQQELSARSNKGIEFYDESMCGHYVDVVVGYNNGWTNAAVDAYVDAIPSGGISPEGTFQLTAMAYKYNGSTIYDWDTPSAVPVGENGASIAAGLLDTWGAPQVCELWGSAAIEGTATWCADPWIDYGPCV